MGPEIESPALTQHQEILLEIEKIKYVVFSAWSVAPKTVAID